MSVQQEMRDQRPYRLLWTGYDNCSGRTEGVLSRAIHDARGVNKGRSNAEWPEGSSPQEAKDWLLSDSNELYSVRFWCRCLDMDPDYFQDSVRYKLRIPLPDLPVPQEEALDG